MAESDYNNALLSSLFYNFLRGRTGDTNDSLAGEFIQKNQTSFFQSISASSFVISTTFTMVNIDFASVE